LLISYPYQTKLIIYHCDLHVVILYNKGKLLTKFHMLWWSVATCLSLPPPKFGHLVCIISDMKLKIMNMGWQPVTWYLYHVSWKLIQWLNSTYAAHLMY